MFPSKIQFALVKEPYNSSGWRYQIKLDDGDWWVMHWWDSKPREEQVKSIKFLILRGMEVYHKSITKPSFCLNGVEDE